MSPMRGERPLVKTLVVTVSPEEVPRYLKMEDVPVSGWRVNGYKPDEIPRGCVAIAMRR